MSNTPQVGQYMQHSTLGRVTIIAVHDFGTVDVQNENGKCFRLSGYSWGIR